MLRRRGWTPITGCSPRSARSTASSRTPAVSLALAKRDGANAVVVAEQLRARLETLRGRLIPEDVTVTVTRDYGETANEKANELRQLSDERGGISLAGFLESSGLDLEDVYKGNRSWSDLREAAGLSAAASCHPPRARPGWEPS